MEWLEPWLSTERQDVKFHETFRKQLKLELPPGHVLYEVPARLIGRGNGDDALFELLDGTGRVAQVHLTWAALRERVHTIKHKSGKISVRELVASVQHLHTNASMPGHFFRSLPSSIYLKWRPRVSRLSRVWAFMSMIVPRARRVLLLLVREQFIATTLPALIGKSVNQQA